MFKWRLWVGLVVLWGLVACGGEITINVEDGVTTEAEVVAEEDGVVEEDVVAEGSEEEVAVAEGGVGDENEAEVGGLEGVACEAGLIEDALGRFEGVEMFWTEVRIENLEGVEQLVGAGIDEMEVEMIVHRPNHDFVVTTVLVITGEEGPPVKQQFVGVDERLFIQSMIGEEEWQVMTAEAKEGIWTQFMHLGPLTYMVENGLPIERCVVMAQTADKVVYQYELTPEQALFDNFIVWMGLERDLLGKAIFLTEMELIDGEWAVVGGDIEAELMVNDQIEVVTWDQLVYYGDEGLVIEAPIEVVDEPFFLEVPLPDDAAVMTAEADVLVFNTFLWSYDETVANFTTFLVENGWNEPSSQLYQGEEIFTFEHDSERALLFTVRESNGARLVVLSRSDE
ncbi:MAG TPA: hypothetical protein VLL52_13685 [Anaerolineae bacterium]|nr:hypothetical protein [Anaerolineae bacterium]